MTELFKVENYINQITLTTTEPTGFKTAGKNLVSTANNIFIYKKNQGDINKLYTKKGYDKAYSKVLLNKDESYENWKYSTIKSHLAYKKGVKSSAISTQDIEAFALTNPAIVFRTTPITGGARIKRKVTIDKSNKDKAKVLRHPNDDVDDFYILGGGRINFLSKTYRTVDGDSVPAQILTDVWNDISWTGIAKEGGVTLKNGKKPEKLLKRVIEMGSSENDIVLDYHLGSGTTAAVAHKMGRRYIGIEQLYYGDNDPTIRLQNVVNGDQSGISKSVDWQGGGSFVYASIMNNSNKFRKRVEAAKNDADYIELLKEATTSSFLSYRVDPKKLNEDEFKKLSATEKRRLLLEIIDNNTLYVNYEDINDPIFKVSEKDKEFNNKLYEKK